MAAAYMPNFGERAAPVFNQAKPRELPRYFKALERLFARAGITADADKKEDAIQYVDYEVEQIWKTFPEYANPQASYAAFKAAVIAHYPDATGDFVYSVTELDAHIKKHREDGIVTTDDLQEFHLKFLAITTWLIEKDQMGEFEQRRDYIRAFAQPLSGGIKNRLGMKFLDQHPNKPHKIQDVYEAARYVLLDESGPPISAYLPKPSPLIAVRNVPVIPLDTAGTTVIKTEMFASVMADFSKTVVDALRNNDRSRITGPTPPTRNTDCNFCGGQHFIRECKIVDEYILAGKCRRNFEGKVTLSTGAFCPRDIPGTLLRERVDEWHHRYPNQLSVASLVHTISAEQIRASTLSQVQPTFNFTTSDRICALEAELFNLRARKSAFVPVVRTRAQKAREFPSATIEEVPEEEPDVPIREEPAIRMTPARPVVVQEPTTIVTAKPAVEPEHPFQLAKDAIYAPPTARNVGVLPKVPANKATAPLYKTLPPIHDPAIALEVYKRAMDAQVTISQRELLSLSPEIRGQYRDATTTKRVPTTTVVTTQGALQIDDSTDDYAYDVAAAFTLGKTANKVPPRGATIVADPIESYLNSLGPGETPSLDRLTVAKESTAIRSIHALVDTSQKKECTVDPGCQIIAMSESTCHSLGLAYDPSIRLNMESANGNFDWSLGLARNIPFLIGTITLYLQVHVIRSPSYEILLGRPFDVLTESVIRNFTNEDQTITITDPNTDRQCTIPTFARGTRRVQVPIQEDF